MNNFWNIKISIKQINNDYSESIIYENINGQLYQSKSNISGIIAENSFKENNHIIIEGDKIEVRKGQIVFFTDKFGEDQTFKINELNFQDFKRQAPLIDMKLTQS